MSKQIEKIQKAATWGYWVTYTDGTRKFFATAKRLTRSL